MAQCPKCDASLSYVDLEDMTIKAKPQSWNGVAYVCPYCNAVDPIALKDDTVREILDHLRKD